MRPVTLANVGLSLIGFFALVQALAAFPSLATWGALLAQHEQGRALVPLITILPFALLILLGLVLITKPASMARLLWARPAEEQETATGDEIPLLIFAGAGVVVFAGGLPDLFHALQLSVLMGLDSDNSRLQLLAGALARVVLGLVLFFRPHMVLEFWRPKHARVDPPPG
ncbi:MAG: hypothetical protein ACREJ4_02240 [Candidatus Methylomirabilaceae bacterium]